MYFYFLESSKVIYFWQHCSCLIIAPCSCQLKNCHRRSQPGFIFRCIGNSVHSVLRQKLMTFFSHRPYKLSPPPTKTVLALVGRGLHPVHPRATPVPVIGTLRASGLWKSHVPGGRSSIGYSALRQLSQLSWTIPVAKIVQTSVDHAAIHNGPAVLLCVCCAPHCLFILKTIFCLSMVVTRDVTWVTVGGVGDIQSGLTISCINSHLCYNTYSMEIRLFCDDYFSDNCCRLIHKKVLLSINIRFLSEQYLSGTLFLKPASTRIPSPHFRRSSVTNPERCAPPIVVIRESGLTIIELELELERQSLSLVQMWQSMCIV